MTITLPGYANPHYLNRQLAANFPAMEGRTQVIATTSRKSGGRVMIMTNAVVDGAAVEAFVRTLSAEVVTSYKTMDALLTPDQQPKAKRQR